VPRAGLSTSAVVEAATALLDERGPGALTLANVAARTGVAAPSLYKHVDSLAALRSLVSLRILEEVARAVATAVLGRSGDDAVTALMLAYQRYAAQYPSRYALFPQQPGDDPRLDAAGQRLVDIVLAALRGYGLEGSNAIHAARCVRATMHGFAVLQIAGGFGLPEQTDVTHRRLVRMVMAGLRDCVTDG
jgi:AcrR family transcriptional regulator